MEVGVRVADRTGAGRQPVRPNGHPYAPLVDCCLRSVRRCQPTLWLPQSRWSGTPDGAVPCPQHAGRPWAVIARPSIGRAAVGLVFCGIAAFTILQGYDIAASHGWLGAGAQTKYVEQSGSLGVLVGGRSEVLVSTQAIMDSPILGHGSWAKDFTYVDLLAARLSSAGYEIGAGRAKLASSRPTPTSWVRGCGPVCSAAYSGWPCSCSRAGCC